jgi:hypothetical protein
MWGMAREPDGDACGRLAMVLQSLLAYGGRGRMSAVPLVTAAPGIAFPVLTGREQGPGLVREKVEKDGILRLQ